MSEFHDLSELALNDKGQSWGNLGNWTDEQDYSAACRSLAHKLAEHVGLNHESSVMDVGFGCGDQLSVWLNNYLVADVCGINVSRSQTQVAKDRLASKGFHSKANRLMIGSANDEGLWQELLSDSEASQTINTVLALDCAYHFPDKAQFFSLAHQYLSPGGQLGLSDLVFKSSHLPLSARLRTEAMLGLSRIPRANMMTTDAYSSQLEQTGFQDIELCDISETVMLGFSQWLERFKQESRKFEALPWSLRLKYNATAKFLKWAYQNEVLDYVMVKASKAEA